MKKFIFQLMSVAFVLTIISFVSLKALPDKTYTKVCMETMDIKEAVVMDVDQDDHYETMKTTWCDFDNGNEIILFSPIIYPPEASKGLPINDVGHDPFPFHLRKRGPRPNPKKGFILEFFPEGDTTTVVYDYQMYFDDPNVYYTQYVPYTDVVEPMDANGIRILPNPASSDVTMTMDVQKAGSLVVKIFSQNGQQVATIYNSTVGAGAQEFNFNVNKLSSGVYFVQTKMGTETYVNSLFVVK